MAVIGLVLTIAVANFALGFAAAAWWRKLQGGACQTPSAVNQNDHRETGANHGESV